MRTRASGRPARSGRRSRRRRRAARPVAVVADVDGSLLADHHARLRSRRRSTPGRCRLVSPGRRGAPFARPGKVVGIGLNYQDHAAESGASIPDEPVVFLKPGSSVCGPTDDDRAAAGQHHDRLRGRARRGGRPASRALRRPGRRAGRGRRLPHGQRRHRAVAVAAGPTWAKGKCADTFTPIGPWLVTPDEVRRPAGARADAARQRRSAAVREDPRHGLRRRRAARLPQRPDDPRAGRPGAHRHARRGGGRSPRAQALPAARRRRASRGRRSGQPAHAGRRCAHLVRDRGRR